MAKILNPNEDILNAIQRISDSTVFDTIAPDQIESELQNRFVNTVMDTLLTRNPKTPRIEIERFCAVYDDLRLSMDPKYRTLVKQAADTPETYILLFDAFTDGQYVPSNEVSEPTPIKLEPPQIVPKMVSVVDTPQIIQPSLPIMQHDDDEPDDDASMITARPGAMTVRDDDDLQTVRSFNTVDLNAVQQQLEDQQQQQISMPPPVIAQSMAAPPAMMPAPPAMMPAPPAMMPAPPATMPAAAMDQPDHMGAPYGVAAPAYLPPMPLMNVMPSRKRKTQRKGRKLAKGKKKRAKRVDVDSDSDSGSDDDAENIAPNEEMSDSDASSGSDSDELTSDSGSDSSDDEV